MSYTRGRAQVCADRRGLCHTGNVCGGSGHVASGHRLAVRVAACSGATTAGNGDGDVSVGALRAQARKDLAGLGPSLVPASGVGWAFPPTRPRRTRPFDALLADPHQVNDGGGAPRLRPGRAKYDQSGSHSHLCPARPQWVDAADQDRHRRRVGRLTGHSGRGGGI